MTNTLGCFKKCEKYLNPPLISQPDITHIQLTFGKNTFDYYMNPSEYIMDGRNLIHSAWLVNYTITIKPYPYEPDEPKGRY